MKVDIEYHYWVGDIVISFYNDKGVEVSLATQNGYDEDEAKRMKARFCLLFGRDNVNYKFID